MNNYTVKVKINSNHYFYENFINELLLFDDSFVELFLIILFP